MRGVEAPCQAVMRPTWLWRGEGHEAGKSKRRTDGAEEAGSRRRTRTRKLGDASSEQWPDLARPRSAVKGWAKEPRQRRCRRSSGVDVVSQGGERQPEEGRPVGGESRQRQGYCKVWRRVGREGKADPKGGTGRDGAGGKSAGGWRGEGGWRLARTKTTATTGSELAEGRGREREGGE